MMKSAGIFAASIAAAFKTRNALQQQDGGAAKQRDYSLDLFTMRFDGLRFIESLITAHR